MSIHFMYFIPCIICRLKMCIQYIARNIQIHSHNVTDDGSVETCLQLKAQKDGFHSFIPAKITTFSGANSAPIARR